jgi:hypothetical protein
MSLRAGPVLPRTVDPSGRGEAVWQVSLGGPVVPPLPVEPLELLLADDDALEPVLPVVLDDDALEPLDPPDALDDPLDPPDALDAPLLDAALALAIVVACGHRAGSSPGPTQ